MKRIISSILLLFIILLFGAFGYMDDTLVVLGDQEKIKGLVAEL